MMRSDFFYVSRIKFILSIKFLLVFFLATIISCQNKRKDKNKLHVFRYNETAGITSLDPAFAKDQANIWICNQLYNGLVQLDDSLHIKPCIAKSWEITDNGKTYIFHLRNDVLFHSSELFKSNAERIVRAKDFVFSFNRIVDEKTVSPGAWIFKQMLQNADGSYAFTAVNDTTLVIRLKDTYPPFLGILTMKYCSVVSEKVVNFYGKEFRKHPIGTGPFQFKMWNESQKLILTKNKDYFEFENGARLPYMDAVSVSFIVDKETAFLEFVKGNFDFLSGVDAAYINELLTKQGTLNLKYTNRFKMISQPYLNTEYLGFMLDETLNKNRNNSLKNIKIRQAINYGFDRKKMIRYLRNNIGIPANKGIVPIGLPSFDQSKIEGYDYNPEKAKQLLAEAGCPDGEGLPEITIATNASYLDLCKYIQQQLNEIGFKIKIDVNPPATLREMIAKSKSDFFRGSWIADYPDAENYLSMFYSANFCPFGPNYTHFSDKEFDKYYDLSLNELNDSVRSKYYEKMDQIIMNNAAVVPLYYDKVLRFVQKNVEGIGINPMNLLVLKRVRKIN